MKYDGAGQPAPNTNEGRHIVGLIEEKGEATQAMIDALQVVILDDKISEFMIANDPMVWSQCMDAVRIAALMNVAVPTDSFIDAVRKEGPKHAKGDRAQRLRQSKTIARETISVRMKYASTWLQVIGDQPYGQFVATEGAVGDWTVYVETEASRDAGNGYEDICKLGAKITQDEGEALFPRWATLFVWRD